ncbi:MAG: DUF6056 family protein [Pyrinomonadaceae bacterium]
MIENTLMDKKRLKNLALLFLLLSLIPFLILTFFCHPAYDDFCNTRHILSNGFIQRQIVLYNKAGGRYFATALLTVIDPLTNESFRGYKALAFLIVVLSFVSIYSLVTGIFGSSVSRRTKLIAAAFLMALFSNQTPEVTEMYYFMTGAIVYQFATILTLLFYALVIRLSKQSKRVRLFSTILSCLLIVAIVGSNETSMLILAILNFTITFYLWRDRSQERWRWLIFSLVTIVCAAIVILAPGNAVRASLSPPGQHRFGYSVSMSLRQEVSFLSIWLSNFAFVLSTIFFIPFVAYLVDRSSFLRSVRVHPLISSFLLLLLIFIGLFPAYWTQGMMGQHRTVATVYFFFLLGWFLNIVIWMNYLKSKHGLEAAKLPNYVYAIGVPVILCTLLLANNTRVALGDLVHGRAYRYDQAVNERYSQFKQCAREGAVETCPITVISDPPTTITNPYYEVEFKCEKNFWELRQKLTP